MILVGEAGGNLKASPILPLSSVNTSIPLVRQIMKTSGFATRGDKLVLEQTVSRSNDPRHHQKAHIDHGGKWMWKIKCEVEAWWGEISDRQGTRELSSES